MSAFPPQLPGRLPGRPPAAPNPARTVILILACVGWLGVTVVADFLAFMMFAFADSPSSANAAKLMIVPVFIWFGIAFVVGASLLYFRKWWTIVPAFVLAISPPFVVFAGYNLLSGVNTNSGVPNQPPAPSVSVPQGGFRPAPMNVPQQPDFRSAIPRDDEPTSQPAR